MEQVGVGIRVRGFVRLQLVDHKTGKILKDTGFKENAITATGFQHGIVGALGGVTASSQITHVAIGTQTAAPSSAQTSLTGEFGGRKAVTNSFVANGTLRMTANYGTNEATQSVIGAVGVYGTSSGGSIMNAMTVATSQKTTDQQLNLTVEFRFS